MHNSAATPRENHLSSLGKIVLPCCPWARVPAGFNPSWSGKAKQQQFASALLGFCSAPKLSTPAEPSHNSGIWAPREQGMAWWEQGTDLGNFRSALPSPALSGLVPQCFYPLNAPVRVRQ